MDELLKCQAECERQINKLSLLRLVFFLAFLASLIGSFLDQDITSLMMSILSLTIFIVAALRQTNVDMRLKIIKNKLHIYKQLDEKKSGMFGSAGDPSKQHDYCFYDLDVFGEHSLMRLLSFKDEESIQKALEHRLVNPNMDIEEIYAIQEALKELNQTKLNIEFLSQEYGPKPTFLKLQPLRSEAKWFIRLYPLFGLAIIFYQQSAQPLGLLIVLGWLLSTIFRYHYATSLANAKQNTRNFASAYHLSKWMTQKTFTCDYLRFYQSQVKQQFPQYKQLKRLYEAFEIADHMLLSIILDGLFLYHGWVYLSYLNLEEQCKDMTYIYDDFAALCQMSLYLELKPQATFPKLGDDLSFQDLKHPLMTSCVGNDFSTKDGCVVITGSNMSGKTTFMRTIGLSLLMFYYGLPVDAKMFRAPQLQVYTSMRVVDDLSDGVSSFYGELNRIKEMIACAKEKKPAVFFIDEIFKGTNMSDRIIGAKQALATLCYPGAYVFLSTHDLALCAHDRIEIQNYHFKEHFQDAQIAFDYKIKKGICETTNAKYLMKMIGLLEEESDNEYHGNECSGVT